LNALPGAIAWFFSPSDWLQVVRVLVREVAGPSLLWLPLLGLLLLRWRARAIRAAILATAHPLRWVSTDRVGLTLKALGSTLLLAVPWPLLLALLGWRLEASLAATLFTKAIGHGALEVAFALFVAGFPPIVHSGWRSGSALSLVEPGPADHQASLRLGDLVPGPGRLRGLRHA